MPVSGTPYERFTKDELNILVNNSISGILEPTRDKIDEYIKNSAFTGSTIAKIPVIDLNLKPVWLDNILEEYGTRGFVVDQDRLYIIISWE